MFHGADDHPETGNPSQRRVKFEASTLSYHFKIYLRTVHIIYIYLLFYVTTVMIGNYDSQFQ